MTVSVRGVDQTQLWNPAEPFNIGHPFRWVLEKTADGAVIRNISDDTLEAACSLSNAAIQKGASIELPENQSKVSSGFQLKIVPMEVLPPAYQTHEGEGELRVYPCVGEWMQDSVIVKEPYEPFIQGKKAFTVKQSGGEITLKSRSDELTLTGEDGDTASLKKGKELTFTAAELSGSTLALGEFKWRFESMKKVATPSDVKSTVVGAEAVTFKKAFVSSLVAIAALLLLAIFFPKSPEDQVTPPQVTRIVMKKHVSGLMTAAAMGISPAHDNQTGNAAHPKPMGVAHLGKKASHSHSHAQAHRIPKLADLEKHSASPAKKGGKAKVAKSAAPKANRVAVKKNHPSHLIAKNGAKIATPKLAPVVINDQAFKAATQGLTKGGMASLLGKSSGHGKNARAEAQGLINSGSALSGSEIAGSDSMGSPEVQVAALGGGSGNFGGSSLGYGKGSHAKVAGQGHSVISMDTGASDVEEGLTKEQVGAVIHSHMSEIRYCYEAAMLRSPEVEGKLMAKFTIGAPGSVKGAGVGQSTLGDRKLNDCVMQRLVTWKFPHPKGGVNVAVNYPFIFKTLGR